MGSASKRHFKQTFVCASSNAALLGKHNRRGEFTAPRYGGRYKRSELRRNKGEGAQTWRAVIHLALRRSQCD